MKFKLVWYILLIFASAILFLMYQHFPYQRYLPTKKKADIFHVWNSLGVTTKTIESVNLITKVDNTSLQNAVQNKFDQLQNPVSCEKARKFVCKVRTPCGLGCEIHHLGICMFIALGTNRTVITDVIILQPWLDQVFKPMSRTCQSTKAEIIKKNYPEWKSQGTDDIKDVQLTVKNAQGRGTVYVPGSLPSSLLPAIHKFNRDPVVWWIGQVMAYICRFTSSFQQEVENYQKRLEIDNNDVIVGLHIRRTDKVRTGEGKLQTNERYMQHVIDWFDKRQNQTGVKIKRKVYLATDDVSAVGNLRKSYPNYTFICDENVQKKATPTTRVSLEGIKGIMLDLTALSKCNFVVCTFSSNIGRFVYELMQFQIKDPSDDIISLDIRYDYPIPHDRLFTGTLDHRIQNAGEKYTKPIEPFGVTYPNFDEIS